MSTRIFKEIIVDMNYYKKTEKRLFVLYLLFCSAFSLFGFLNQSMESIFIIVLASGFYFSFRKYVRTEWITNYKFEDSKLIVKNFNKETVQFSLLDISTLLFDDKTLAIYIHYKNGDISKIPCRNDSTKELLDVLKSY